MCVNKIEMNLFNYIVCITTTTREINYEQNAILQHVLQVGEAGERVQVPLASRQAGEGRCGRVPLPALH